MLEKWIRLIYQRKVVTPLIPFLDMFTPCQITVAGGISGILSAACIILSSPLSATILLLLSGLCDTLDGSLARHDNHTSNWGCALDIFTDRVVECAMILGLFFVNTSQRAVPCMLMLISILLCITSFLLVGIFSSQEDSDKSFDYSPGLMERAEAFLFFITMTWVPALFELLAYAFTLLVFITSFIRLYQFKLYSRITT